LRLRAARLLEGVSKLWICYFLWAYKKNSITSMMARSDGYPSAALPALLRDRYRPTWPNAAR
jgi:hypothetical protein